MSRHLAIVPADNEAKAIAGTIVSIQEPEFVIGDGGAIQSPGPAAERMP